MDTFFLSAMTMVTHFAFVLFISQLELDAVVRFQRNVISSNEHYVDHTVVRLCAHFLVRSISPKTSGPLSASVKLLFIFYLVINQINVFCVSY